MRIGVQFQTHGVPASRIVSAACEAADLGVDGVFLWDHLVPFVGSSDDSAWETWTLLGAMVGSIGTRTELGVLVSPLSFRHPQLLARAAATLASLVGGSFILGVGAGGFVHDDFLFDDHRSTAERMADFSVALAKLRSAVDDQNRRHGVVVRIWVGGEGRKVTLPLAARFADGWSGFGPVERWIERRGVVGGFDGGSSLETSVLLTPLDEPVSVAQWGNAGPDWLIRSLRPDGRGDVDLEPIRRLLADAR